MTHHHGLAHISIADSVASIGQEAFASQWTTRHQNSDGSSYTRNHWIVTEATIGANVSLGTNVIGGRFETFYNNGGRLAGVYWRSDTSSGWVRFSDTRAMERGLQAFSERERRGQIGYYVFLGLGLAVFFAILVVGGK